MPVRNLRMRIGNNSYAPVLGRGMAIISLNGQHLLIRDILHVPELWLPLYSLCAHIRQPRCGFIGSYETSFQVYFSGMVLSVNTSTNCHLSYAPLGKSAPLSTLHLVQPCCAPTTYPTERSALCAHTSSATPPSLLVLALLAIIEDGTSTSCHWPFPLLYRVQWHPGLIPMKIFPHSTFPSQNVPLDLELCLPLRLSLPPPGFCHPLPTMK
jgi:hypothetical protein